MVVLHDRGKMTDPIKRLLRMHKIDYEVSKDSRGLANFVKTPVITVDGKDMYFAEAKAWIKNCGK